MPSPRILIVRTSALGDIVHALPSLTALRNHFPSATIGWVVEETFAPLLRDHPLVDELLEIRLRTWRARLGLSSTWREAGAFFKRLQGFSAEIVLDLMGNHKAGAISALSLADRRIGHASADRREPSSAFWNSESIAAQGHHAVDRMLSLVHALGVPRVAADFAPRHLAEQPCEPALESERYVLLHPVTGWGNKDYPAARWATVVEEIARFGDKILIAPGPGEEEAARRIAAAAPVARVLEAPTLPGLVYLQRRAALVLGGDTGPVHLAHALGTPVVCVMGPTDPRRHGPYAAAEKAVSHRLPCSYCHKKLDGSRACLLDIEPLEVVERACQILGYEVH